MNLLIKTSFLSILLVMPCMIVCEKAETGSEVFVLEHQQKDTSLKNDTIKKKSPKGNQSNLHWSVYCMAISMSYSSNPNHGLIFGTMFAGLAAFLFLDLILAKKAIELLKEKSLATIEKENSFIFSAAKMFSEDADFNEQTYMQENKKDAIFSAVTALACFAFSYSSRNENHFMGVGYH